MRKMRGRARSERWGRWACHGRARGLSLGRGPAAHCDHGDDHGCRRGAVHVRGRAGGRGSAVEAEAVIAADAAVEVAVAANREGGH